jgi:hypothetical protein
MILKLDSGTGKVFMLIWKEGSGIYGNIELKGKGNQVKEGLFEGETSARGDEGKYDESILYAHMAISQ